MPIPPKPIRRIIQDPDKVKKKSSNFGKWVYIALIAVALATGFFLLNNKSFSFSLDPYKPGDKLYLVDYLVNDTTFKHHLEPFYTGITPLKDDEIDEMNIDLAEKDLIKRNISFGDKAYGIENGYGISTDSLCKRKNAYIGTFVRSVHYRKKVDGAYESMTFYEIKPDTTVVVLDVNHIKDVPQTHKYDYDMNGLYFIEARAVTDKNTDKFREIKTNY
ncbi:hypothetical protein MUY27_03045 [Mucilaginibacter sp. RS28]|uniref:Uncharacterized protein n=1 Tax=Mucilaginibacter straminoryzae TaxID=2932774 RepID=A0A9X2BBV5_9SPHI|nr:hypothetical protein [Mucilaginibacter straminoryzae]MCJ8208668.1 hypothetical protein [Mucilaginibacter straminoryzae]